MLSGSMSTTVTANIRAVAASVKSMGVSLFFNQCSLCTICAPPACVWCSSHDFYVAAHRSLFLRQVLTRSSCKAHSLLSFIESTTCLSSPAHTYRGQGCRAEVVGRTVLMGRIAGAWMFYFLLFLSVSSQV